ncbi:MAG: IS701 family transposase [Desulfococcus sp.]|nr:MAG: IS701 family transposase [Desulfococcus sp.]
MEKLLDLYADYLSVTCGYAVAAGLSGMLHGEISHDRIARFLANGEYTSRALWQQVKSVVREVASDEGVLVFDDTIQEEPWMGENDLICWYFDHCTGRNVKGINLLNCLYHVCGISIPVAFELIRKSVCFCGIETRQEKPQGEVTKNELMRSMIDTCVRNQIKFRWILFDSWLSSIDNMKEINVTHEKDFIGALKSNRLVAFIREDQKRKRFTRADQIGWPEQEAVTGWLKGLDFPVRQVFISKDGSTGIQYLACSQLTADWNTITIICQKRWNVEVFHKSLKSSAALAKLPARRINAQANHIFASIIAVFKILAVLTKTPRMKEKK